MICLNINLLQEIIIQTITESLNTVDLEIIQSELQILQNTIIHHLSLQILANFTNTPNIYTTIKGLIPHTLIQTIRHYTNSLYAVAQITIKLLLKLNSTIYEQLWIPYCTQYAN